MRSLTGTFFTVAALVMGNAAANSDKYDCVAQVPTEGILVPERLAQITTIQGRHRFFETAEFRGDFDITLGIATGGCAHYAVDLIYVFKDDAPIENKSHYLAKAKFLLEKTPFKEDALSWKSDFLQAFERNKDDAQALETGIYELQPGYSTVYLATERDGENVTLTLVHDIAL